MIKQNRQIQNVNDTIKTDNEAQIWDHIYHVCRNVFHMSELEINNYC